MGICEGRSASQRAVTSPRSRGEVDRDVRGRVRGMSDRITRLGSAPSPQPSPRKRARERTALVAASVNSDPRYNPFDYCRRAASVCRSSCREAPPCPRDLEPQTVGARPDLGRDDHQRRQRSVVERCCNHGPQARGIACAIGRAAAKIACIEPAGSTGASVDWTRRQQRWWGRSCGDFWEKGESVYDIRHPNWRTRSCSPKRDRRDKPGDDA